MYFPEREDDDSDMIVRFKNVSKKSASGLPRTFFNAVRDVVDMVYESSDVTKTTPETPPPDSIAKANELYALFRPLADTTDLFQRDCSTANDVILSVFNCVERIANVVAVIFPTLKTSILDQIQTRFTQVVNDEQFIIAAFVDPRQKFAVFQRASLHPDFPMKFPTESEARSVAKDMFRFQADMMGMQSPPHLEKNATEEESVRTIYDALPGGRLEVQVGDGDDIEFQRYVAEPLLPGTDDILKFWQDKSLASPVLASIAKRYLAIPASTGAVERIFSVAGSIGRARMTVKNMSNSIFLREHRKPKLLKRVQESFGLKARKPL